MKQVHVGVSNIFLFARQQRLWQIVAMFFFFFFAAQYVFTHTDTVCLELEKPFVGSKYCLWR